MAGVAALPRPAEAGARHAAHGQQQGGGRGGGEQAEPGLGPGPGRLDPFQHTVLEAGRRCRHRPGQQQGVGGLGQFVEQLPAARALLEVVEQRRPPVPREHVEGQFVEHGCGFGAVHRHASSAGVVNRDRMRRNPRRIRVLAVPSGIDSEREISSAVRP